MAAESLWYVAADIFHGRPGLAGSAERSKLVCQSNSLLGSLSFCDDKESGSRGGNREDSEIKERGGCKLKVGDSFLPSLTGRATGIGLITDGLLVCQISDNE